MCTWITVDSPSLENRSDVGVFWGFSNSTGKSILNNLEAVYLGDVYVQEERIAGVMWVCFGVLVTARARAF